MDDIIDYSGAPRTMGEQKDMAFKIMRNRMLEVKQKQIAHVAPLMRGTALKFYAEGLDDAFKIFTQVAESSVDEELSPG